MEYSPFFGMNILVAKPILPLFYVGSALFVVFILFYVVLTLVLISNVNFTGGKDA